jgi:hypothetical protein
MPSKKPAKMPEPPTLFSGTYTQNPPLIETNHLCLLVSRTDLSEEWLGGKRKCCPKKFQKNLYERLSWL